MQIVLLATVLVRTGGKIQVQNFPKAKIKEFYVYEQQFTRKNEKDDIEV